MVFLQLRAAGHVSPFDSFVSFRTSQPPLPYPCYQMRPDTAVLVYLGNTRGLRLELRAGDLLCADGSKGRAGSFLWPDPEATCGTRPSNLFSSKYTGQYV